MPVRFYYTEAFVISAKNNRLEKPFIAELIDDFEQRLTPYPDILFSIKK